jgi:hypothetical protein
VEFAVRRHGYGNTDGGFGVIYPSDLDGADRAAGENIPDGFVQVYGFWGPPDGYELFVSESEYLDVLAGVLGSAGHPRESEQIRSLAERQRSV